MLVFSFCQCMHNILYNAPCASNHKHIPYKNGTRRCGKTYTFRICIYHFGFINFLFNDIFWGVFSFFQFHSIALVSLLIWTKAIVFAILHDFILQDLYAAYLILFKLFKARCSRGEVRIIESLIKKLVQISIHKSAPCDVLVMILDTFW